MLNSLESVLESVLAGRGPLPPSEVGLADALGRVLANDVVAAEAVPRFANSAMDGFALLAVDTLNAPVRLSVVSATMAGEEPAPPLLHGQAVRIMTGAPVPVGADAVCILESTRPTTSGVLIEQPVKPGANIRLPGEDVMVGSTVFRAGTVLGPAHLGVLASLGESRIVVRPAPVVAVLSTGNEVVDFDRKTLRPAEIRDANRVALLAALRLIGAATVDLGIVGDDDASLRSTIESAVSSCDVLITSGGIGPGDRDILAALLSQLAGSDRVQSFQIAIRPARPFLFAHMGDARIPLFGLPGNPVAAFVSFQLLVKPALLRLAGRGSISSGRAFGVVNKGITRRRDGKLHYVLARGELLDDGRIHVRATDSQGSHLLRSLSESNALIELPDGEGCGAGDLVRLVVFDAESILYGAAAPENSR